MIIDERIYCRDLENEGGTIIFRNKGTTKILS